MQFVNYSWAEDPATAERKAVDLAPSFADAHFRLGFELAKVRQMTEAVSELQQAVQLRPNSVEYRVNYGYALGTQSSNCGRSRRASECG